MTEKCTKCGNDLQPEWAVCPICKKKIKSREVIKVENEYFQYRLGKIENYKQMSQPFNQKLFNPVFLAMILLYIFTLPLTGPIFGFLLPLLVLLSGQLIVFTILYALFSILLRIKRK
jgi:uncharacterized OB-fold protein